MGEHILNLVTRLNTGSASEYSCDRSSSSVRTINCPIPVTLARDLEALASLHHRDVTCLAGDLLAASIMDIISALPAKMQEQMRQAKAGQAAAEEESHREALSWDAGRT